MEKWKKGCLEWEKTCVSNKKTPQCTTVEIEVVNSGSNPISDGSCEQVMEAVKEKEN